MTRALVMLVLAGGLLVGAVLVLGPATPTGSEPIVYGRDTCAHCRMHLTRPGFAAEWRDRSGALAKYDDIGCMVRALLDDAVEPAAWQGAWVEDHDDARLTPLGSATVVRIAGSETPMGSGLVAFAGAEAARAFADARGATIVSIETLLTEARAERARERKDGQS
jgi:copper chaperone NosL